MKTNSVKVFAVYAANADHRTYVVANDDNDARRLGGIYFGTHSGNITARYVITTSNPSATIQALKGTRKGAAA